MNSPRSQTKQEPKTKMRMVSYSTSRTRQDIIEMVDSKHFVIWTSVGVFNKDNICTTNTCHLERNNNRATELGCITNPMSLVASPNQHTIHRMLVITELCLILCGVNIWFHLDNQFCKK
jgi:hypothetical protein